VVYSITPANDMAVNMTTCYSSYDTKMYVYENEVGNLAVLTLYLLPLKSLVSLVTSVVLYPEDQKLPPGFGTSMLTLTTLIVILLI
jgi:hypothetical protein